MQQPIDRVRGFSDTGVDHYQRTDFVLRSLLTTFRLAGFSPMDVPVVEYLELYMRKSGAQVLSKLYGFSDQGRREVALRPEFTASVIRALASSIARAPEPVRVSYAGPVFRYEKPQRVTTRQFTQAGVELLGEPSPAADADLLALACQAALAAGVPTVHLVVGHLGPLRALLAHLDVDGYAEGYLLEHLEYYNRGPAQQHQVRRQLGLDRTSEEGDDTADALAESLSAVSPSTAQAIVNGLLRQMGVDLDGNTRTPEEIVERILEKARRQAAARGGARRESLERALHFCTALSEIRGEPTTVLADAERLLRSYDVPSSALGDLREVIALFEQHQLPGARITLAPGMARGIAYYSGLIFELYAGGSGRGEVDAEVQICGGGRYDGLPLAITGRQAFPALGFAFGLERLLHCIPQSAVASPVLPRVAVAAGAGDRRAGLHLTAILRQRGWSAVMVEDSLSGARRRERLGRAGYHALILADPPDVGRAPEVIPLSLHEDPEFMMQLRAAIDAAGAGTRWPVPPSERLA